MTEASSEGQECILGVQKIAYYAGVQDLARGFPLLLSPQSARK